MDHRRRVLTAVVGTRPEIVKVSPVVAELRRSGVVDVRVHHSGQHYSPEMSAVFEEEFGFEPDERMPGSGGLGWHEQMARLLIFAYERLRGDWVLVQGDTNTPLAYAMAARQLKMKVVHLEAGLRSADDIVENRNRVAIADLAHLHLTISETGRKNLLTEGIAPDRIVNVGSTAVDHAMERIKSELVPVRNTAVVTIHREENSTLDRLRVVRESLKEAGFGHRWFAHPRTWRYLDELGVRYEKPVGYRDFLQACARSHVVLTDSGGVAEEMTVFKRPVVQVRQDTERPEMLGVGMELAWTKEEIVAAVGMLAVEYADGVEAAPFGDGRAAERAAEAIERFVECESAITEPGLSGSRAG